MRLNVGRQRKTTIILLARLIREFSRNKTTIFTKYLSRRLKQGEEKKQKKKKIIKKYINLAFVVINNIGERALVTYLHLPIKVQLFVRPIIAVTSVGYDLISGRTIHRGQFHAMYETTESKACSMCAQCVCVCVVDEIKTR